MVKAKVYITIKDGVLEPQGKAIAEVLHSKQMDEVAHVKVGKFVELELAVDSVEAADSKVKEICERVLVNPEVEDYRYELEVLS